MSSGLNWVSANLSLGGLVRHAGRGLGLATNITVRGVGEIACLTKKDLDSRRQIRSIAASKGAAIGRSVAGAATTAGNGINLAVQKTAGAAGAVSAHAVRVAGGTQDQVETARKVGTIIGAAVVGTVIGAGVADAAVALSAAAGTAGAAATTSGLAALGG